MQLNRILTIILGLFFVSNSCMAFTMSTEDLTASIDSSEKIESMFNMYGLLQVKFNDGDVVEFKKFEPSQFKYTHIPLNTSPYDSRFSEKWRLSIETYIKENFKGQTLIQTNKLPYRNGAMYIVKLNRNDEYRGCAMYYEENAVYQIHFYTHKGKDFCIQKTLQLINKIHPQN